MEHRIPTSGIFVSYHHDDRIQASAVCAGLADHGFDVVWDQLIPVGERWEGWLKHEIRRARVVMICATVKSIKSESVRYEVNLTKESGKRPVFVLLDDMKTAELPWGTQEDQMVMLKSEPGAIAHHQNWPRLIGSLESRLRPVWVGRRIASLEEELDSEHKRRLSAEEANSARAQQNAKDVAERTALIAWRDHLEAERSRLETALVQALSKLADTEARLPLETEFLELRRTNEGFARALKVRQVDNEALETAKQTLELKVQRLEDIISAIDPALLRKAECSLHPSGASGSQNKKVAGSFGGLRYESPPYPLRGQRLIRVEPGTAEITCYPKTKPGMPSSPVVLRNRVERPFEIGEGFVTAGDWTAIMSDHYGVNGSQDAPRTGASFDEALTFIERLNIKAGGGFYLLCEKEWLFAATTVSARHNAQFPEPVVSAARFEWMSGEWDEYARLVDGQQPSADRLTGRARLTRRDVLLPDAPQHLFQRQFWPPNMRSEQIGFRIARRV